jgi:hypothetical protein
MKNKWSYFAAGILLGEFIAIIVAYKNAEKIAATKQSIQEDNRDRGTPILWIGRRLGKLFITPQEASFASEADTIFQTPPKEELAQKPGNSNDEFYDSWFLKYIIYRKLTSLEAWGEVQKDHPEFLPKKLDADYELQKKKTKKSFIEAMRRRRKKLSKIK